LACAFPLSDNYFAWQGFARRYAPDGNGPLPPYLQREQFAAVRARAERVRMVHGSMTEQLAREADGSLDGYVLLDAQDWMTDAQLAALWHEITRTARPGARVIFRTADEPSILPGRLDETVLRRWSYAGDESRAFGVRDRSSTYGGFHLYVFGG
jgi:S-adenosylmethionine-diacylglycerol 3-amino-3-carboxypropyl transferase